MLMTIPLTFISTLTFLGLVAHLFLGNPVQAGVCLAYTAIFGTGAYLSYKMQ